MCRGTPKGPQRDTLPKTKAKLCRMLYNEENSHLHTSLHWVDENRINNAHNINPHVQGEHKREHSLQSSMIQGPSLSPTDPPIPRIRYWVPSRCPKPEIDFIELEYSVNTMVCHAARGLGIVGIMSHTLARGIPEGLAQFGANNKRREFVATPLRDNEHHI